MATAQLAVIGEIESVQKQTIAEQYNGRMSNQFVDECKGSALFQFNWGELLGAAPTAISMMCACYVAASNDTAEKITLTEAKPTGGFKYLTERREPTLRACLIDVCNAGGREAFTVASKNMESVKQASWKIREEHIPDLFTRLSTCMRSEDDLDDFKRGLKKFSEESKSCAAKASAIQLAFNKWGRMVCELHATTEQKSGQTSIAAAGTALDKQLADIEQTFAKERKESTGDEVKRVKTALDNAEKRLDRAMDNVPGPWATVLQTAVSSYAQALPAIAAAAVPIALAAANPAGAAANSVLGALRPPTAPAQNGAPTTAAASATTSVQPTTQPTANDPASAVAYQSAHIFTAFFAFLGDDSKDPDWKKFEASDETASTNGTATSANGAALGQSGIVWLLGHLQEEKKELAQTGTEASNKLSGAFDKAIKVANEIKTHLGKSNELNSEKPSADVVAKWKVAIKAAKNDVLALSAASGATASTNTPRPFANVKIDAPKPDLSAQTAQLNGAMQGVQIAQNALDAAQTNYDNAIKKQEQAAAAMLVVEQRLKSLNDKSKLLDNIKVVLRDCIAVLVDLSVQIGKLEKFFTLLSGLIEDIILKKTDTLTEEMSVVGDRSFKKKTLSLTDVTRQTIYVSTLQSKAYFSMLYDIAYMYAEIDRDHIIPGLDMCSNFSGALAKGTPLETLQDQLSKYNEGSGKAVKAMIEKKQGEILDGLKDRARAAAASSQAIESALTQRGLQLDTSAKAAIEDGAIIAKEGAKAVLATIPSRTAARFAEPDLSKD